MWNLLNKGGNVTKERFTLNQLKYSNAMKALIDLYYSLTAGFDVYMKQPGKEIMNRVKKNLDIDISADLEYVAAPASQHGSVHRYEMKGDDWQTPDFINLLKVYLEGDDWQTPNIKNLLKVFFENLFGYCDTGGENEEFYFELSHLKEVKEDMHSLNRRGIVPWKYDRNTGISTIRIFTKRIRVSNDELKTFRRLMDTLCEAIEERKVHHFDILYFRDEINTSFKEIDHDDAPPQNDFQDTPFRNFLEETERMAVDSLRTGMLSMQKIGDTDVTTTHHRMITVRGFSEFGQEVMNSLPLHDQFNEIPHINSPSCREFIQIIRALFVIYQMEFDNYDRIKLCKYCNKLFFEKKKGAAVFCSSSCRKKDYVDHQPPEKLKCRQNQNAWIRNRFLRKGFRVYNVGKHECTNCSSPVKSGECPIIRNKNRERLVN